MTTHAEICQLTSRDARATHILRCISAHELLCSVAYADIGLKIAPTFVMHTYKHCLSTYVIAFKGGV